MRKKYKQVKNKEDNIIESQRIVPSKNYQLTSNEKKKTYRKVSNYHLYDSNPTNTISYSSKESIKFRKIHPLKKEENKKIENNIEINNIKNNNIINNKDIKKENNKIIYNNENKNLKFDKKRKMMPELNSIDYIKFNRIKNNLHYKNNNNVVNEKIGLNTEPNINEIVNQNNEKIKVNNLNMRTKYSIRYYKYKNKNNNNEIKEKKDNILNEEKNKKINILEKIEKDNKMKENDSQKKGSNITYDNNRVYKFKDYNKNDNISYSNKNDSSKILSLIKKCNRRSMHINLNNPNNKKINIENNDNNEKIEKESNLYYNTEKKDNIHIKSTSTTNTRNKTKNSFNFLIHQAHENSNLSDTFSKIYESYMNLTNKKMKKNELKNSIKCLTMDEKEDIEKPKNTLSIKENISLNSISLLIKEYGSEKLKKKEFKVKSLNIPFVKQKQDKQFLKKNQLRNLLEISPKNIKKFDNDNKIENIDDDNDTNLKKSETINVTNKIVNNNTFNTTYNIYKINNTISKKDFPSKKKEKEFKNTELCQTLTNSSSKKNRYYKIFINKSNFKKAEKNKACSLNYHLHADSFYNNPYKHLPEIIINQEKIYSNTINIEIIYLLESKNRAALNKINNYEICYKECNDWIIYYFDNNIYDIIINLFKNKRNKNNIINKIKIEILCYFLCYDASFSKTFNQAGILLKTIFHLLQNSFLLLLVFIINNFTKTNDNNDDFSNNLINNLNQIIHNELRINLSLQEIHNENCIIEIFEQNYKQINNYYKMIIDNLYDCSLNHSTPDDNAIDDINNNKIYKFPQCLSLDIDKLNNNQKIKIISLFFFDAYKLINNYNILDLKMFYDLFLNKSNNKVCNKLNVNKIQKYINYHKNKYKNQNYSILSNNLKFNYNTKYILYPIKSYYKYTLMINLDNLAYCNNMTNIYNINIEKNKKVILRPEILQFLQEMKQIYELILFSNNSLDYISKILKNFENNEKYFEYILSNNQLVFEKDGSIKNIDLLGRDIKNIIILDKDQSIQKLNKENIIYVKPFYGNINEDGNILSNLTDILKKIIYDMEDNDDIRIALNNNKLDIITKITTNLI